MLFANDISPRKFQMYSAAFPDAQQHFHVGDIYQLDHTVVPSTTLATCSFPCTDLSLAGNYKGLQGAHSSAFWGFIDVLRSQGDSAPPLVLLENVPGWLHSNGGQDFRVTIEALNNLGYVCDVFTLDALRFTPQSRPRVFVVASRIHLRASSPFPSPERSSALASPRLKKAIQDNADLGWMWLDLPEPPVLLNSGLGDIVDRLPDDDPRWWSDVEVARHLAMMSDTHRAYVSGLADGLFASYRTIFRRMRAGKQRAEVRSDDLSGCLRTASGGSARQILMRAGQGRIQMRHMVAREYARLQGVPDDYPICVGETDALTGFGDAVCVPLVCWIGRNVLAQLII